MAPYSSLTTSSPQAPVLLVFTATTSVPRGDVEEILDGVRSVLNPGLQVMHISETTHPEVVRSFGITALPAFVLLLRGQELWRCCGPVDKTVLFLELINQMNQTSLKTH